MLAKKVETLTKAMEVEAKKMRREVAAMEKKVSALRVEKEHENRSKRFGNAKDPINSAQLLPARYLILFHFPLCLVLNSSVIYQMDCCDVPLNS